MTSDKLPIDCGGPHDMKAEHTATCWEDLPQSPAEATITHFLLTNPEPLRGKRLLHVGIGNGALPDALDGLIGEYVGITISKPELDRFREQHLTRVGMLGILMNKHDPRQFNSVPGTFDLIIDTLLKAGTCCEKHFEAMMDFYADRLASGGMLLTTLNGINFEWSGMTERAYTPGAKRGPDDTGARILGEEGIAQEAQRLGLELRRGPTGATGDVILMLCKA